jgi:hypothetical protein
MDFKGQASIEFIFVLVFMFVLLVGVILPLGQTFRSSLDDVGRAGSLSSSVKQVEYSLRLLTNTQASGQQEVSVFIPRNSNFTCDPGTDELSMSLPLALPVFTTEGIVPASCVELDADPVYAMICEKAILVPDDVDLRCGSSTSLPFVLETGGAGFTQTLILESTYDGALSPPYVVDVRTGG